jgi:predicted phosphate transport protein (TIGR00153 family)
MRRSRDEGGGVARINLVPQRKEFFELYSRSAGNLVQITELLVRYLERFPGDGTELVRDIKELEHEGDRLTHDIVSLLNRTFVTPFDRDDMYRLAGSLDDICDHVDEAAGNIASFGVEEIRPAALAQARLIHRAATKLHDAVGRLEGFQESPRELHELHELEDEGDRVEREAISELFRSGDDAISVIRWKDIHERLEEAVDACQHAGHVLEAILVKNR